jgi:hypothetical protein
MPAERRLQNSDVPGEGQGDRRSAAFAIAQSRATFRQSGDIAARMFLEASSPVGSKDRSDRPFSSP